MLYLRCATIRALTPMNDVDLVKQKIDIADFIGQYVKLQRAGRNEKGLCPFHGEKSPSFMVSRERQTWHCFGCQKGGDIFSFLMEYEKIDFSESLKILAKSAGVTIHAPVYRTEQEQRKDVIYSLNSLAAQFYHFLLTKHAVGKDALTYLTDKRAIPLGLIEKLQLGYAPHKPAALFDFLIKKKKQNLEDILASGLVSERYGRTQDFFNHRIIFPITDVRENIIAFSGRALTDDVLPKYINTRETLVYKKSESLFGIAYAKDSMKKEGRVLLVEGEFDVISCFKEGISNVVAVKGTALTIEQIKLLKRYADKVLFCFDTDKAGTAAQKRSIALLENEGVAAAVIVPPEGKDPDELLRENPVLFKKALKEEINIYDFLIHSAIKSHDASTPEGKRAVLDETIPMITQVDNEVIKEHYLKKLAEAIDTSYESVLRQSAKTKPVARPVVQKPKKQQFSRVEVTETYLVALALQSKDPTHHIKLIINTYNDIQFFTPQIQSLMLEIRNYMQSSESFVREEFVKMLPAELIDVFDTCCLAPLPDFETDGEYTKEVQKKAREACELSIQMSLKQLTEQLQNAEKSEDDTALERVQADFMRYTTALSLLKSSPLE